MDWPMMTVGWVSKGWLRGIEVSGVVLEAARKNIAACGR